MNDFSIKTKEKQVAEEIWLNYFNNYLYNKGVISESERNRMVSKIANRKKTTSTQGKKKERDMER